MKANEIMTRDARTVRVVEKLDAAARAMWEQDCGIVPVVDASGVLVGVITDRDVCMAGYTQGRSLSEIPVASAMAKSVRTCRGDDAVAAVLATMQQAQVHRLPVVDAQGKLLGILSMNDLVRAAQNRPAAMDATAVLRTLAAIGMPRKAPAKAGTAQAPAAAPAPAAASSSATQNVLAERKEAAAPGGSSSSLAAPAASAPKPGGGSAAPAAAPNAAAAPGKPKNHKGRKG